MTKIYLVHCHNYKSDQDFVSEVFTNKKKAENYKTWRNQINEEYDECIFYMTEHVINTSDYNELIKAGI